MFNNLYRGMELTMKNFKKSFIRLGPEDPLTRLQKRIAWHSFAIEEEKNKTNAKRTMVKHLGVVSC